MNKLHCDICQKELSMVNARVKVQDGIVCRECLIKAGLGELLIFGGKEYTLEGIRSRGIRCDLDIDTGLWNNRTKKQNKPDYNELAKRSSIFNETKVVKHFLSIDEDNRLLKIVRSGWGNSPDFADSIKSKKYHEKNIISFDEIISYEVIENEETISQGGYGMAAIGALTFGGAGGVAGSILGKKTKGVCRSLKIKLTIDGLVSDVEYLHFVTMKTKKSSFIYKQALSDLHECVSALEIILSNHESDAENTNDFSKSSDADEIKKYWELLQAGAITEEEFNKKKSELL